MSTSGMSSGAPSPIWEGATFPGFGEDAPLNLPELSDKATRGLGARVADRSWDAFSDALTSARFCTHPVRLRGRVHEIDSITGEARLVFDSTDSPLGQVFKPCGNRREHVCPSCSRLYARDTFEVIRTGVQGGKQVPDTVADNPLLFVTLTAPSFGLVHATSDRTCRPRRRDDRTRCPHGRPTWCHAHHTDDDKAGTPLCDECYDYATHVVWQWWAPELWRRFTMNVRRALARRLSVSDSGLKEHASIQFAKVAEYQARGAIHFHALLRLDGPADAGIGSPAPHGISAADLRDIVNDAATTVRFTAPPVFDGDTARSLTFGAQLDVRIVRAARRTDDPDGALSAGQVAGYLAKYATKDATNAGGRERRPTPHMRQLRHTCQTLYERSLDTWTTADNPYLLLGKWEHALGFRGHFSSKSRRYSVTLGALRRARARWHRVTADAAQRGETLDVAELERRLLAGDDDTTLVVGEWSFAGTGWPNPGDAELAAAAAARAREYDQWRADNKTERTREDQ